MCSRFIVLPSVHPRLRGELHEPMRAQNPQIGSSPLTRGTRSKKSSIESIIPVHPRLRGELVEHLAVFSAKVGSSPLTRGTLIVFLLSLICLRFIPAYAGNSIGSRGFEKCRTVHPRLRGELNNRIRSQINIYGSSPLTRGTHLRLCRKQKLKRFIPAYAGNS